MNLYVDDNLTEALLIQLLVKGGHTAVLPADVGMSGNADPIHFEYAIRQRRIILTNDSEDFENLHRLVLTSGGSHPGVFVVRHEKDSTKNMKPKHIAAAVTKLEKSGTTCTDSFIVLNHWR